MQYITWVARNTTAWTVYADGVGADDTVEISARPIPQEPMVSPSPSPSPFSIFQSPTTATYARTLFCMQYILANLGISTSFTTIDYDDLIFPAIMQLDYIRVRPTPGFFLLGFQLLSRQVYQRTDSINIGCDPSDFPTADYISTCVFCVLLILPDCLNSNSGM